jgi:hypothetical protein
MKKMDTQVLTLTKQINYTKEPKDAYKNNLKEEILQVISENLKEMILES